MRESFASGDWHVIQGKEEEFVSTWREFLGWTSVEYPALIEAGLLRDEKHPGHFVSFARWGDPEARAEWKNSEGFATRFSACRSLCEKFSGGDYERVVLVLSRFSDVRGG